jgi:hypothetical protein
MIPVLRLHYVYRDEADQLSYGSFDFHNPEQLGVKQAMSMLEPLLIGEVFFIPNRIGIPALNESAASAEEDDDYHEVESLEGLELDAAEGPSFNEFIEKLRRFKQQHPEEYW